MVIRTATERPEEQALRFLDRHLVDAGVAVRHQSVFGEEPVFVSVGAEPLSTVVAILIGVAHSNTVAGEGPQLLDKAIFVFLVPLALQESLSLFPIGRELDPVTPARIQGVRKGDLGSVARVPAIFGQANLLDGGLVGERGNGGRDISFPS